MNQPEAMNGRNSSDMTDDSRLDTVEIELVPGPKRKRDIPRPLEPVPLLSDTAEEYCARWFQHARDDVWDEIDEHVQAGDLWALATAAYYGAGKLETNPDWIISRFHEHFIIQKPLPPSIPQAIKDLPKKVQIVYELSVDGQLQYVGVTGNPKARLSTHWRDWLSQMGGKATCKYTIFGQDREAALAYETHQIHTLAPARNRTA